MKALLLTVIYVMFLNSCSSPYQVIFENTKVNSERKGYHKLLIAGMGNVHTRIFLQNLAEGLDRKLKSTSIESEYYYLGADVKTANHNFRTVIKQQDFDAVLVFNQANNPFFAPTVLEKSFDIKRLKPYTILKAPYYSQSFRIQLYEMKDKVNSIWEAKLDVDLDLTQSADYIQICKMIIASFKKNKLGS